MALAATAALVPKWIPPGQHFWAMLTGVAHLLAGTALAAGVFDLLASRLLTTMIVFFGLLVWLPAVIAQPHVHMMWSANCINLALLAAAWVVADSIAIRRHQARTTRAAAAPKLKVTS